MAHTSEIEKLERRYAENPKGRNFAPLADAYRKAGQLDQAIELCTSGLEHHPDYVSAHIVYGRCLIDKHDDERAGTVFRKVLELDPENVIAFKVLAEIGARSGRLDEAVLWLTKLLNADPMNGDAAEALAVAKGKASQAAKATTPVTPVAAPVAPPVARLVPDLPDIVLDPEPVASSDLPVEAHSGASEFEVFDGTMDFSSVASTARADGIEIQEEIVMHPQEIVVEGLASTQYEASGLFKVDADAAEDDLAVDLPLIMPDAEEEPSAREDAVVDLPPAFSPPPPRSQPSAGRTRPTPIPPPVPTPAAVMLSDDDGAADTAALSRAEPVLTETMAELYLKQGHAEEALRVYQALQVQRPGDGRLRAKVEALSGRAVGAGAQSPGSAPSGQTLQAFLQGILASRPGMVSAVSSDAAPPDASPLGEAFAAATPDPDPPGEPTRAAPYDLSLNDVFGDDASASLSRAAVGARPETATPPAAAPAVPPAPGGFSFDEFFNTGGAPNAGSSPAASSSGAHASGSRARPPLEEDGDLDQFQDWLKGLKS